MATPVIFYIFIHSKDMWIENFILFAAKRLWDLQNIWDVSRFRMISQDVSNLLKVKQSILVTIANYSCSHALPNLL